MSSSPSKSFNKYRKKISLTKSDTIGDFKIGTKIGQGTFSKVCILIDDAGKSYVTGSKMFTNQMIDYIRMFGTDDIKNGVKIKIVKNKMSNSDNKYLAFELL